MASRKRNRSAGGAGASGNRRKKNPKNSRKRKRAQSFEPRRRCWLYDGQILLGTLFTTYTGETQAFDAARKSLGTFPTFKAAVAAINNTAKPAASLAA